MSNLNKNLQSKQYHEVIIIGAGLSGIATGIKLLEAKIDDFIILKRATEVGGVWRDNQYPGCECSLL
ncbi:NAD(P)-binding protein [Acinetobacter ursingii]|uniref:NAD(P)-binding protein n=1 Tax=Acinetobacter ursingii TaxID=108980 RepID=UPI0021CDB904|nr:NAD(P)-binding protein [Acinetobacter ursingii]MCU4483773.1 NAD(P)-binding protein [Acinetobacter ursingii]MCU4508077.1 NAD(P)-binding protein [Acinetobacter ursingii]MCU4571036.1 NAD(P)-binding protein [Acinetobacter ursingii]